MILLAILQKISCLKKRLLRATGPKFTKKEDQTSQDSGGWSYAKGGGTANADTFGSGLPTVTPPQMTKADQKAAADMANEIGETLQ